jgi:hypothetical protein
LFIVVPLINPQFPPFPAPTRTWTLPEAHEDGGVMVHGAHEQALDPSGPSTTSFGAAFAKPLGQAAD